MSTRTWLRAALLIGGSLTATAQADAKTEFTPYIEIGQIVDSEFSNGGDTVTYTTAAAGFDGSIRTERTEVQANYRYRRYFAWEKGEHDQDTHNGLIRGQTQIVPGLLSVDGGALATRTRVQYSGAAPEIEVGSPDNTTQVYSLYAGPTLSHRIGDLNVNADYHIGWTKVTDKNSDIGDFATDTVDRSTVQTANLGVGMGTDALPFAWTATVGWEHENANQLSQRYTDKFARVDVTVPVAPTVAALGSVGYEDIRQTQADFVRDANGAAVIGNDGRFISDKSVPRLLIYDQDGLIWDVGVEWRPNRRTRLEARVGKRYGGWSYTGQLTYTTGENTGLSVVVYDGIQSFGRGTISGLQGLPTSFAVSPSPLNNNFSGCVFGTGGAAGGCLSNSLQSADNANFRNRGVTAVFSGQHGLWSYGVAGGYSNRRYIAPNFAGDVLFVGRTTDETWTAQADIGRKLSRESSLYLSLYGDIYDSGIALEPDVKSAGAISTYTRNFGRIQAQASVGLNASDREGLDSYYSGTLEIGARYSF